MIRIRQGFLAIALITTVTLTPSVASADRPVDLGPDVAGFGDAANLGSTSSTVLASPIVGLAPVPTGGGYWEAAADGGVFAFGSAGFFGSLGAQAINAPIVGIAAAPDGKGYWLAAADGGVFAFGSAGFFGSLGAQAINAPIVGIAAAPDGKGYWLAAADGGVFAFGSALFRGSLGGQARYQRVVGIAATVTGNGYWLVSSGTCAFSRGTSDQSIEMATTATSLLTDINVAQRSCFDRVTFTFRLNAPADRFGVDVGYRSKPFLNTAGNPVQVKGNAFLSVRLFPTSAIDQNAPTFTVTYVGPPVVNTSKVVDVVKQEDFEAQMNWVIGLDRVRDFTVTQNAGVLTIDVG
ncbi:MAG: hypothetical protein ABJD24_17715 [Acidimicrobiales bacterium]